MDLLKPVVKPSGPVFADENWSIGLQLEQDVHVLGGVVLEVGRHEH